MSRVSDEDRARVVELATTTKLTYPQIADEVGVSRKSVSAICREAQIRRKPGPPRGTPSPLATFTRDDLAAAARAGTSFAEFGRRLGVSRRAVWAAARRWGIASPCAKPAR